MKIEGKWNKSAGYLWHIFWPFAMFYDQLLPSFKKREEWFKSSFHRFSTNTSTIAFCISWNYWFIRAPKQTTKPDVFSESPSEIELSSETLILETQLVLDRNWVWLWEKLLKIALFAHCSPLVPMQGIYLEICLSSNFLHKKLATDILMEVVHLVVFQIIDLEPQQKPCAFAIFDIFGQSGFR